MSYSKDSCALSLLVRGDFDIETDDDGQLFIVCYLCADSDETGQEIRVLFEDIIDSLIEFYESADGTRPLYTMAHELSRMAERLRTAADALEGDLFSEDDYQNDLDDEQLER